MVAEVAPKYYSNLRWQSYMENGSRVSEPKVKQQRKLRLVDEEYLAVMKNAEEADYLPSDSVETSLSFHLQEATAAKLTQFISEIPDWVNATYDTEIVDFPRRSAFLREPKMSEGRGTLLSSSKVSAPIGKQSENKVKYSSRLSCICGVGILKPLRKVAATTILMILLAAGGFTVGTLAGSYENQPEPVEVFNQPLLLVD